MLIHHKDGTQHSLIPSSGGIQNNNVYSIYIFLIFFLLSNINTQKRTMKGIFRVTFFNVGCLHRCNVASVPGYGCSNISSTSQQQSVAAVTFYVGTSTERLKSSVRRCSHLFLAHAYICLCFLKRSRRHFRLCCATF